TADIDVFDLIGILRDLQCMLLELHRKPCTPALDRIIIEMLGEVAVEIAAGRHYELPVDLTLGGILGESDLARLFSRDMAEMLSMLCLIPGLIMPGRRR